VFLVRRESRSFVELYSTLSLSWGIPLFIGVSYVRESYRLTYDGLNGFGKYLVCYPQQLLIVEQEEIRPSAFRVLKQFVNSTAPVSWIRFSDTVRLYAQTPKEIYI